MSRAQMQSAGFTIVPAVIPEVECEALGEHISAISLRSAGTRNLLSRPWCTDLARALIHHPEIGKLLPSTARAIQCTLFEKSPIRTWLVSLHQDLSIPVAARVEHGQCTGWSEKEGVTFTQPGVAVLDDLVAVRVHIDACPPSAGPLRVVPSSHRAGQLSASQIVALRNTLGELECPVPRGGVLAMKPLLLHASSKASNPAMRRVLHFLFGPSELPYGLRWHVAA